MRLRPWLGLAVLFFFVGSLPRVAGAVPLAPPAAYRDDLLRLDALARAGQVDSARTIATRLVSRARGGSDRHTLAYLLRVQGQLYAAYGLPRQGEAPLRESVDMFAGLQDSASLSWALRWYAVSLQGQGLRREAMAQWSRLYDVARAAKDSAGLGSALMAFGYDSLRSGRCDGALERYRNAVAVLEGSGDVNDGLNARLGLVLVMEQLGEYDSSRAALREVATRASEHSLHYVEANAWNNLGTLEFSLGDPGEASVCFRRAWEVHTKSGSVLPALTSMVNLAITLSALGRFAEAESLLTVALETSRREGLPAQEAQARAELGDLEATRGQCRAALAQYDAGLALGDRLEAVDVADLAFGRAQTRIAMGDAAKALRELDDVCLPIRSGMTPQLELILDALRAELRVRTGDAEGALAVVREAKSTPSEDVPRLRLPILVWAARAERMLGRRERAAEDLRLALQTWETDRRVPLDPDWRAQRTADGRSLFAELLGLHLEARSSDRDAEVVAAYDLLQRFKARSLRERMQRPATAPADSAAAGDATTLAGVRGALTSDEVLLDCFVGPDSSWVFTVSRDACRVIALPGEKILEPRVRLLVDFLASAPVAARSGEVADQAARAIATPLLAGIEGTAVSHVLFAPDGVLRRLPLALLGRVAGALAPGFDVTVVPSATILVDLRARPAEPGRRDGMVVLEGPLAEGGTRLAGVEREVRDLRRGYARVAVLADSVARSPELWTRSRPQVIHVAAHSLVDDERPWRSGIRLAAPSRDADPYLRAETISATREPASLVVLSSCSSAGGASLTGEGVEGLASAFLTGGAESVVATLWPVEDRAAAQIMHEFYREVALGKPVAGALRGAQEAMRRDASWSDPFFWAGYVVLGNGAVEIPLRARPWGVRRAPWILGTALLLLAVPAILRRRSTSARRSA